MIVWKGTKCISEPHLYIGKGQKLKFKNVCLNICNALCRLTITVNKRKSSEGVFANGVDTDQTE